MFALRFFPCSGVCRYAYLFMALVLVFILAEVWTIWDSLSWSIGLSVYVFFVMFTCFPLWYSCLRSEFSRAATTAIAAATNWLVLCSSLPPTFWCWLKGHSLIPTWLRVVVAVWSFQEAFVFGAHCGSPITLFNPLHWFSQFSSEGLGPHAPKFHPDCSWHKQRTSEHPSIFECSPCFTFLGLLKRFPGLKVVYSSHKGQFLILSWTGTSWTRGKNWNSTCISVAICKNSSAHANCLLWYSTRWTIFQHFRILSLGAVAFPRLRTYNKIDDLAICKGKISQFNGPLFCSIFGILLTTLSLFDCTLDSINPSIH